MHIAITGANGFIGSYLSEFFRARGHRVTELVRRPGPGQVAFDLRQPEHMPELKEVDTLIHCAFVPFNSENKDAQDVNISGTAALIEACRMRHIKFVFLSSLSANSGAVSVYGKQKYAIEKLMNPEADLIIRPGLVIGHGGLFLKIRTLLERSIIVPMIDGGKQPLQIIAIFELAEGIEHALSQNKSGLFTLASATIYTMADFYKTLAGVLNRKILFVPVPYFLIYWPLRLLELLPLQIGVTTENLIGLKNSKTHHSSETLKKLGLTVLSLEETVQLTLKKQAP